MATKPDTLRGWNERMAALHDGVKEQGRGELQRLICEAGICDSYFHNVGDTPTRRVALMLDNACDYHLLDPPERRWAESWCCYE